MTIKNKEVLLFDLDGTLVDSAPDLAVALNKMLRDLSKKEFDQDTIRTWVGNGAKILVERGLSGSSTIDSQLDSDLANKALSIFLAHYRENVCVETVLYDGVKEGLDAFKEAGFRLGIITNKPAALIQPILAGLGVDDMFDILIGADTLAEKKPHPAQLLYAVEQLNVTAEQCLMIGDSKNDILAAKAAKMDSVGLTYGYNYGENIANYHPQWCFDRFSQLTAALQR
ncbi:MAG: phosphoglycolate phosphatase [Colwellia sp.]